MKVKSFVVNHGQHKGMVKFCWAFYLKNGDHRYAEFGSSNPCHYHFDYFNPDVSDAQVNAKGDSILDAFEAVWNADTYFPGSSIPKLINTGVPFQSNPTQERIAACNAKADDLKTKDFEKEKAK